MKRTAFTLIELLVVISIIALLISLLLPALRTARESARSMQCLANERQIGISVYAYANDSKDYVPPVGDAALNTTYWKHMAPYLGHRGGAMTNPADGEMFGRDYLRCPVDPTPPPLPYVSGDVGYGIHYLAISSYETPPGASPPPWYAFGPRRLTELSLKLFMFADTRGLFIYSPSVYGFSIDVSGDGVNDSAIVIGADPSYNRFDPRHFSNNGNILIVDGSARTIDIDTWQSNLGEIWFPVLLK